MNAKTKILNLFRSFLRNEKAENFLIRKIEKKSGNSFYQKLVPNHYQYPKNTLRKREIDGIKLNLDISDYIGHYLYFGLNDYSHLSLFRLAKPDNVVIDIGANIGFTALNIKKIVGDKGVVHAFEPDPYNFAKLNENLQLNPNFPVIANNVGLGNEKGEFKLFINTDSNRGGNRINNQATTNYSVVKVETLDNYVNTSLINKVSLIKIDVEGFELNVLKGAHETLSKFKPILFIELDDNNLNEQNASALELIQFLENLGYKVARADNNQSVSVNYSFQNCHFDIICRMN